MVPFRALGPEGVQQEAPCSWSSLVRPPRELFRQVGSVPSEALELFYFIKAAQLLGTGPQPSPPNKPLECNPARKAQRRPSARRAPVTGIVQPPAQRTPHLCAQWTRQPLAVFCLHSPVMTLPSPGRGDSLLGRCLVACGAQIAEVFLGLSLLFPFFIPSSPEPRSPLILVSASDCSAPFSPALLLPSWGS